MDKHIIDNNFTYHAPTPEMQNKFPVIRGAARELAHIINELVPEGREKALAMTKLQEAVMWANAGITIPKDVRL